MSPGKPKFERLSRWLGWVPDPRALFTWSTGVGLVRSLLPQVVVLLPILALAVHIADRLRDVPVLAPGRDLILALEGRFAVSMAGAVLVVLGLVLYLFCPRQIRTSLSRGDYVRTVMDSGDLDELEAAQARVSRQLNKAPQWSGFRNVPAEQLANGLRTMADSNGRYGVLSGATNRTIALPILAMNYELLDRSRGPLPVLTVWMLLIGGLIAVLPTALLVWQVLLTAKVPVA